MKKTFTVLLTLMLGLFLTFSAAASDEAAKTKPDRISGTIQSVSKDTSTISVRDKNGVIRQVVLSDATTYTKVNKPGGTMNELKEGTRVICLGKFDDKQRLAAARCDIRLPK